MMRKLLTPGRVALAALLLFLIPAVSAPLAARPPAPAPELAAPAPGIGPVVGNASRVGARI